MMENELFDVVLLLEGNRDKEVGVWLDVLWRYEF
jgi:hypothetical protein